MSTQPAVTTLKLSHPLDQPERLKCRCGCDHFKMEGSYVKWGDMSVNSVECERCHEIYAVDFMVRSDS